MSRYGFGYHPAFKGWVAMDTTDDSFITFDGKMVWETRDELLAAWREKYPNMPEGAAHGNE